MKAHIHKARYYPTGMYQNQHKYSYTCWAGRSLHSLAICNLEVSQSAGTTMPPPAVVDSANECCPYTYEHCVGYCATTPLRPQQ